MTFSAARITSCSVASLAAIDEGRNAVAVRMLPGAYWIHAVNKEVQRQNRSREGDNTKVNIHVKDSTLFSDTEIIIGCNSMAVVHISRRTILDLRYEFDPIDAVIGLGNHTVPGIV
ncbi:hypothetical protein CHS0354_001465 [Potamilus streckersoni]|uniref:Uncharacterized protein n=1 Tax=Potamilus streckersoni TaxID=2493646 RepID=A0AAE0T7W8_9BIVA|nr:hypothetical protein CHS0354_001465 [Potamilus streckersoni]